MTLTMRIGLVLFCVFLAGGIVLLGQRPVPENEKYPSALNKNAMLDAGLPRDTNMEDGVDEQGDGGGDDDWHYAGDTAPDKCADIVPDVGGDGIGEPP